MNNAILFFYNINIQEIKKINNNYYFSYLNNSYGIYPYNRALEELQELYNLNNMLLSLGLIGYEIFPTKEGKIVFPYGNSLYVLMKIPNIKNRIITYEDVISFNFNIDSKKYKLLDKSNWSYNWSQKIDYISYQFSQMSNKYKIIGDSIDYFIGIWENGISYLNNNKTVVQRQVSHRRIRTDMDLLEFLNPLNFIIDYKERDIGEYLKSYVLNKNYSSETIISFIKGMKRENIIILISRICFPSYYFDPYEDAIEKGKGEDGLVEIINKKDNVLNLLAIIFKEYENYNIPYIEWIKK
ncbi:MAG: hypothetical protein Q4C29_01655 [bacterium]|nr:hypothetical protein [bacterium]